MLGFLPVAYEHAAALIGERPSVVARDVSLLVQAFEAVHAKYRPDILPVGIDLYTVEFEALGGKVRDPADAGLPYAVEPLLGSREDLARLRLPEPGRDGRIGMMVQACCLVSERVARGSRVPPRVCATAVGPFTLAVMLRGYEAFLEDMLDEPAFAESLLAFTTQVGLHMLEAFRPVVDAVMFHESWMAPPLCSPGLYRQFAWEPQRMLFRAAREKGYGLTGLISGGETTALAGEMARTGANMLIADMRSDLRLFSSLCAHNGITLRVNLPGTLLLNRDEAAAKAAISRIAEAMDGFRDWYVGCGVVPYEAVPEDVLWLRDLLAEDL